MSRSDPPKYVRSRGWLLTQVTTLHRVTLQSFNVGIPRPVVRERASVVLRPFRPTASILEHLTVWKAVIMLGQGLKTNTA